ncbi:MAG: pilin [Candidatus Nanogingivalis sp.]
MKKAIFAAILMVFSASFGLAVFDSKVASAACASDGAQLFSIPAWYRGLTKEGSCEIKTISNKDDAGANSVTIQSFVWTVIGNVFDAIMRIVGVVATGYIIWAGFQYMISAGDSGKMANAKTTLTNACIGLVIAIVASGIVQLVMGVF